MTKLLMIILTALFCIAFILGIILLTINWACNGGEE